MIAVESLKLKFVNNDLCETLDFISFSLEDNSKISPLKCSCCHNEISAKGKSLQLATLYNKRTQRIPCFDHEENRHNKAVHVYHPFCLRELISASVHEENAIQCSVCLGDGRLPFVGSQNHSKIRLGVDIGGVLIPIEQQNDDELNVAKQTKPIPGSFETLGQLAQQLGKENIFLISKCGPGFRKKILDWLASNQFSERTGISIKQVHFCAKREQKKQRFVINFQSLISSMITWMSSNTW